jgi:hypothetical protein
VLCAGAVYERDRARTVALTAVLARSAAILAQPLITPVIVSVVLSIAMLVACAVVVCVLRRRRKPVLSVSVDEPDHGELPSVLSLSERMVTQHGSSLGSIGVYTSVNQLPAESPDAHYQEFVGVDGLNAMNLQFETARAPDAVST